MELQNVWKQTVLDCITVLYRNWLIEINLLVYGSTGQDSKPELLEC